MPMKKVRKNYPLLAPTIGNYVRTIRTGNFLFISGCTAVGTDDENRDVIAQAECTIKRISDIVREQGGLNSDIVKLVIYVTNMEDFRPRLSEFNNIIEKYFVGEYPTSTLVMTPGLAKASLRIEIDATVVF
jgi:2-iminobutanoate/2-iminopropanoate deaminase